MVFKFPELKTKTFQIIQTEELRIFAEEFSYSNTKQPQFLHFPEIRKAPPPFLPRDYSTSVRIYLLSNITWNKWEESTKAAGQFGQSCLFFSLENTKKKKKKKEKKKKKKWDKQQLVPHRKEKKAVTVNYSY